MAKKKSESPTALSHLTPNQKNPRIMSEEKLDDLKRSLIRFGNLSDIWYNARTKHLGGGHQRAKVLPPDSKIEIIKRLTKPHRDGTIAYGHVVTPEGSRFGYREVNWDRKTEIAANLASNKHSGEWDDELLYDALGQLDDELLELTGFDDDELLGLDSTYAKDFKGKTDENDIPEDVPAITKPGDLWILGEHRVLCGDCTVKENIEKLMDGEKADMVFTDPPYNVDYDGGAGNPTWGQKHKKIENDSMSGEEFHKFTQRFIDRMSLMTDGCLYVCGSGEKNGRIMFGNLDATHHCSTTIIWNKDRFVFGQGKYHNKYEPIWFGWVKDGTKFTKDRSLSNVWDFQSTHLNVLHPTMKPVALVEQAISHASRKSVADLFLGSGSTLIACEKTNRKCYGMEIDPQYCDVIVKRWEDFTGRKANIAKT